MKIIATTLICYARLTQCSKLVKTGKSPFFNLFVQISGRIWMVIGRCYFLHTSSFSENVASARKVPDLSLMKPKVRSGRIRKFSFFDLLDCERMMWVLSPARAMACAIGSLRSLQFCSNKYLFSFPWKYSKRHLILTLCPYCITCNTLNCCLLNSFGSVQRLSEHLGTFLAIFDIFR